MPSDEAIEAAKEVLKDAIEEFDVQDEDLSEDQLEDISIKIDVQLEEMAKDSDFVNGLALDIENYWDNSEPDNEESIQIIFVANKEGDVYLNYIGYPDYWQGESWSEYPHRSHVYPSPPPDGWGGEEESEEE